VPSEVRPVISSVAGIFLDYVLGLCVKYGSIYIFLSANNASIVGIFFCKDLVSLIVTVEYLQMYPFCEELKEVCFFFFYWHLKSRKK